MAGFYPYPNLPIADGVPSIVRGTSVKGVLTSIAGIATAAAWQAIIPKKQWGIFDTSGKNVFSEEISNVVIAAAANALGVSSTLGVTSLDIGREAKVADFPVELNSFTSYDKVIIRREPTITFVLQGSESERRQFYDTLDALVESTAVYDVVVPEKVFSSHTVSKWAQSRTVTKGAYLFYVDVFLCEVRTAQSQYAKVTIPAPTNKTDAQVVNQGQAQAKTPEVSTLKKISNALPGLTDTAQKYLQGVLP